MNCHRVDEGSVAEESWLADPDILVWTGLNPHNG